MPVKYMNKTLLLVTLTVTLAALTYLVPKKLRTDDQAENIRYKVEESIYMLEGERSRGTGFVAENDNGEKFMVTNSHVCEQPVPVMIAVDYQGNRQSLMILKHYSRHDLCVLTAPKDGIPLPLAESIEADERVFVVGYPRIEFMTSMQGYFKGYDMTNTETDIPIKQCTLPKLRIVEYKGEDENGKQTTLKLCILYVPTAATTVQSDSGASGSPLLNTDGEVVGVVMAIGGNISWAKAVPLKTLKVFLNSQ